MRSARACATGRAWSGWLGKGCPDWGSDDFFAQLTNRASNPPPTAIPGSAVPFCTAHSSTKQDSGPRDKIGTTAGLPAGSAGGTNLFKMDTLE